MIGISILFEKILNKDKSEEPEVDWEALGLKRPKTEKKKGDRETFFTTMFIDPFSIVSAEPALNTSDKELGVKTLMHVSVFENALKTNEDMHVLVSRINEFKRGEAL